MFVLVIGANHSHFLPIHFKMIISKVWLGYIPTKILVSYRVPLTVHFIPWLVWLIHFVTGSLYISISLPYFSPLPPLLWQLPICSLYLSLGFCFVMFAPLFFFLIYSIYKWYHTVFIFHCLTYFNKKPSRSVHVVENGKISLFLMTD